MTSAFCTIKLGHKIQSGRITIGFYNGKDACFTAATHGERILLYEIKSNAFSSSSESTGKVLEVSPEDVSFLNINQPISCLSAGSMEANSNRNYLFVGTLTNIFGYDVENNKDLFFKEVVDGINIIRCGQMGGMTDLEKPIAIAGGNCSLSGFDSEGNEVFWTVTGDNVGALALLDFDGNGENEIIVGSEDYFIRVFKGDQIIGETGETDQVTSICPLHNSTFAYALANGTIGVYERLTRLWRIKSKNLAVSICSFDFDGSGVPSLVTAWSNGKLDIRNIRNGEVLFKDNFNNPLAGVCVADIYQDGKIHLVGVDTEGEVRIFRANVSDGRMVYISPSVEQDAIRELSMKKHHLLLEMRNYETGSLKRVASVGEAPALVSERKKTFVEVGAIPTKTSLDSSFSINMGSEDKPPFIELTLRTNNETFIRGALIFAEGIFKGECHVVHYKQANVDIKIAIPLIPPKNVAVDLHIKAYVGLKESNHFHVFEMTRQLPKFSMFSLSLTSESDKEEIVGFVKMPIQERPSRICMWLNQNFLLDEEVDFGGPFEISFVSLRNGEMLKIQVEIKGNTYLIVQTNDMDLAGDIVQSIAQFLNISDLETEANFPDDISQIEMLIRAIEDYQESNEKLAADIAEQSGVIKTLLIRAEDSRIIGDIKGMRKWYMQLNELNRILITQHQIRCTTNENLMDSIKSLNQIIQKAARLRVGKPKAAVILACRDAVKIRNVDSLTKIITHGA